MLDGCLRGTVYDLQSEGGRGWYLHQAAVAVDGESIEKAVVDRYASPDPSPTSEDFYQHTEILYHFAADGRRPARSALYEKYHRMLDTLSCAGTQLSDADLRTRDMFDELCVHLRALDGWPAFKKIVQDVSERLLCEDDDRFFSEWFYASSAESLGRQDIESWLRGQSERSGPVGVYRAMAQAQEERPWTRPPAPTLADVVAGTGPRRFSGRGLALRYVRAAGQHEVDELVRVAMSEPDTLTRAELLWGLRRSAYPVGDDLVCELLRSDNEDIRDTAFRLMENSSSSRGRELALSLLRDGKETANALSLLAKTIQAADEQLFCEAVRAVPVELTEGDWHSVFSSAEAGIRKLDGRPSTDLLEYIYRQTNCGLCRSSTVRLMREKKIFSEPIRRECLYDSYDETRDFAKKHGRSRPA